MIVAIDGPAGSGKSTIAKMVAEKLSLTFMNTGSFLSRSYACLAEIFGRFAGWVRCKTA